MTRNQLIVDSYIAGETRGVIGARHGISVRRVSQIVAASGATRYPSDQMRAIHAAGGCRWGRPKLVLPAGDEAFYAKVRRYYGAAVARQMVGIA